MLVSIFNDVIGPVMCGPSSSHCAAALRIGPLARHLMGAPPEEILVEFDRNGSLPTTHDSQGSDMVHEAAGEQMAEVKAGGFVGTDVLAQLNGAFDIQAVKRLGPVLPVLSRRDTAVPFTTCAEMLSYDAGRNTPLWRLGVEYAMKRGAYRVGGHRQDGGHRPHSPALQGDGGAVGCEEGDILRQRVRLPLTIAGDHDMRRPHRITAAFMMIALMAHVALLAAATPMARPDGKPADMTKPAQVFILLGQSNMVGAGKVKGGDGSLEFAVKEKKKYPYLVKDDGGWTERMDVRFVRYMSGKGPINNEWMTVKGNTLGPEFGIGHTLGNGIDAPVMVLKCCIGNRALGWDLLPPGSERCEFVAKDKAGVEKKLVYAGYKDKPEFWEMDPAKGLKTEPAPWVDKNGKPVDWYAGKQWDTDIGDAKKALADLEKHYPGAKGYEVAGFFFWQGERDAGNAGHAAHYEKNLVAFIKALRKEFNAPDAKFVLGTLGEAVKGSTGPGGDVLNAHLAVDGNSGKYPEFKGNVATVYTHPMAQGGSGNGHYGGKAEVYMDVGEAMGKAMVDLLKK